MKQILLVAILVPIIAFADNQQQKEFNEKDIDLYLSSVHKISFDLGRQAFEHYRKELSIASMLIACSEDDLYKSIKPTSDEIWRYIATLYNSEQVLDKKGIKYLKTLHQREQMAVMYAAENHVTFHLLGMTYTTEGLIIPGPNGKEYCKAAVVNAKKKIFAKRNN